MLCGVADCRFSQEETAAFSAMLDLTSSAASNRSTRMTFSGAQRPFGPHARDEQLQAIRASLSQRWHRAFFRFRLGAAKSCCWRTCATRKRRAHERHRRRHRLACTQVRDRSGSTSSTLLMDVGHGRMALWDSTIALT